MEEGQWEGGSPGFVQPQPCCRDNDSVTCAGSDWATTPCVGEVRAGRGRGAEGCGTGLGIWAPRAARDRRRRAIVRPACAGRRRGERSTAGNLNCLFGDDSDQSSANVAVAVRPGGSGGNAPGGFRTGIPFAMGNITGVCVHAVRIAFRSLVGPSAGAPANLRKRVLAAERDGAVGAFIRLMRMKFFGLKMT